MEELLTKNILIAHILLILFIIIVMWAMVRINHRVFHKIQEKYTGLHLRFFERVIKAVILIIGIIMVFSVFGGISSLWKSLLGGTAIISAVLAFAAQDAIKDILAGLMISLYKPFEIGNRIMLEDGTAGIIKDITMRHVVLLLLDTQVLIIPNSKLNAMSIRNFSYHSANRSAAFRFHVAYGTDIKKAMKVIRQAIIESPYSIPGHRTEDGLEYGPVYFMAFEDSSLRMDTSVYYDSDSPSEKVISDINTRVAHALEENGIEIPYEYVNVIQKQSTADERSI